MRLAEEWDRRIPVPRRRMPADRPHLLRQGARPRGERSRLRHVRRPPPQVRAPLPRGTGRRRSWRRARRRTGGWRPSAAERSPCTSRKATRGRRSRSWGETPAERMSCSRASSRGTARPARPGPYEVREVSPDGERMVTVPEEPGLSGGGSWTPLLTRHADETTSPYELALGSRDGLGRRRLQRGRRQLPPAPRGEGGAGGPAAGRHGRLARPTPASSGKRPCRWRRRGASATASSNPTS